MRSLRLPFLLAALLVAALGAGCIGAPGKTMTAREGLSDAKDAAKEWADGADLQLLGIAAVEPFKHIEDKDEDGTVTGVFETHLDGNPGDGHAPGWAYGFLAGDRCIGIVLGAGLGVLAEGYETCDGDEPIPDWSVDSDEAASILGDRDDWPALGDDGTYVWALAGDDGKAVWAVLASDEETQLVAVLDADTGDVLSVEEGEGAGFGDVFDATSSSGSAGSVEGLECGGTMGTGSAPTVTTVTPLENEFDLEGDDGSVSADASVAANLNGVGMIRAILSGPDGVVEEQGIPNFTGGTVHFEHDGLPMGSYTLRIEAGPGSFALQAQMAWQGAWCN